MQLGKPYRQRQAIRLRVRDEVIMVREDCPGFEVPARLLGRAEQCRFKAVESVRTGKEMLLLISAGSNDMGSLFTDAVQRRVRPIARQRRRGRLWRRGYGRIEELLELHKPIVGEMKHALDNA